MCSPLIVRSVRSQLTRTAEDASIQSFAENLRKLLLTKPFRGARVLRYTLPVQYHITLE
jgi:transcriptional accessory protein Tex/SPT6